MTEPRAVLERLLAGITAGAWADLADCYAEDAEVVHMFAVRGPHRFRGRRALREHFATMTSASLRLRAHNVVVHETADPEVIVAEYDYRGEVVATGRTFDVANIVVLRVRDGLIVSSRDYHNHLALAAATGRLADLVAALSAERADHEGSPGW